MTSQFTLIQIHNSALSKDTDVDTINATHLIHQLIEKSYYLHRSRSHALDTITLIDLLKIPTVKEDSINHSRLANLTCNDWFFGLEK